MKIVKTWVTVHFLEGEAEIEASLNYENKSYSLSHGSNEFKSYGSNNVIKKHIDRAKCVNAALNYIKKELSL